MSIVLFKDLTTDEYLEKLQRDADNYEGLYVDMEDKEQRKYVKDKALLISGLLKKLDRARIDKSRDYKASVEEEAGRIKERLETANKPFTLLIDDYTEKRKVILAKQKAEKDAEELAIQIESDHEQAIMMDKIATIEAREKMLKEKERIKAIEDQAAERAVLEFEQKEKDKKLKADKLERVEAEIEKKRSENKNHRRLVNSSILEQVAALGIDESVAKKLISAIVRKEIPHISINY